MDKHERKGEYLLEIRYIKKEVKLFKLHSQAESSTGRY
jgi:hypothetical protein